MRILVVDDQKDIRDILRSGLEEECYVVDTAEDGTTALSMAKTNTYDLIILDYVLPKMDGRQVCETLRSMERATPILMLSVKTEPLTKAEALDSGADDFLSKPFSFDELKARMRALLRRPAEVASDEMTLDDLRVDVRAHSVTRAGKNIYLTRKEFMLLVYLMRHKGQVVSRAMLLEHVWDTSVDPFSNTIESHILCLRKKIDKPFGRPLIHTIPGMGYKMDVQK